MSNIIRLSIDVTKLDKSRFIKGAKGTYCDLILVPRRTPSDKGETHIVKQDMKKEEREQGVELPIIGNAKEWQERQQQQSPQRQQQPSSRRFQPASEEMPANQDWGTNNSAIPF